MVTFACLVITLALMCKPTLFFGVNRTSCPHTSQWRLRAYSFCNRSEPAYFCLRDANKNVYKEFCRKTSDVQRPGYEFVIRGELDGRQCSNDRYQPMKLTTNGQSKCMYEKSKCTGEGQIQYNNGTTISDRLCRCDSTHSYGFVKTTGDRCFCDPSIEDCTCYKITCQVGYVLSSDYKCTEWEQFSGNNYCPDIKRSIISATPDREDRHTMANPEAYLSAFKIKKFTAKIILYLMIAGTLVCVAVVFIKGIAKLFPKGTKTHSDEQDGFKLPKDIKKLRSDQIKNWKNQERQIYVTTAMHTVTEMLTKCTCLTVIGHAASGKSTLIHHVALQWLEQRYQIIPIISKEYKNRPLELLKSLNSKSDFPKIYVIDDFCGVDNIDVNAVYCWNYISKELSKLKLNDNTGNNQVKIVLACRKSICESNQFKGLDFITGQIYTIDENYSQEEKCSILEKLTEKDNKVKDCPLLQGSVKYFPLLCKIAASKGVDKLEDVLKSPSECIKQDILNSSDEQFVSVFVCMLFGEFKEDWIQKKRRPEQVNKALKCLLEKCNRLVSKDQALQKFPIQTGIYVTKNKKAYVLVHRVISDIAFAICDKRAEGIFLEHASSSIIATRYRFSSNLHDHETFKIEISKNNKFFKRLKRDLQNGDLDSTFHNKYLKHQTYREQLILNIKSDEEIKKILKALMIKRILLIETAKEGYSDLIEMLLTLPDESDADVDVNIRDEKGRTALHIAAEMNYLDIILSLREHGAKKLQDNQGITPQQIAQEKRFNDIGTIFLSFSQKSNCSSN